MVLGLFRKKPKPATSGIGMPPVQKIKPLFIGRWAFKPGQQQQLTEKKPQKFDITKFLQIRKETKEK